MAVCNLFKKIEKPTGNFLMFSQYVEDVTKMYTQIDQYRVAPSKFIALNIDYSKFNHSDYINAEGTMIYDDFTDENGNIDYNILIPTFLQNHFENGCAFMREAVENINDEYAQAESDYWNPEYSSNMLWRALHDAGLVTIKEKEDTGLNLKYSYIPEIVYYDEINIQSYNEYIGMGYNEMYCYIPNDGKRKMIRVELDDEEYVGKEYNKNTIMGFEDQKEGMLNIDIVPVSYCVESKIAPDGETKDELVFDGDEDKFEFNTILVLYDAYTLNADGTWDEPVHKNIPMGIYFTGIINNADVVDSTGRITELKGSVTNTAIKYVTNPDIFGAGTSYGLRICNRFIVSPNSDYVRVEMPEVVKDPFSTTAQLLSEMGTTLSKMNDVINNQNSNIQFVKDALGQIKNRQTNVPYIKNVMGKNYWFVNGKNTYTPVDCVSYDDAEVESGLKQWETELD